MENINPLPLFDLEDINPETQTNEDRVKTNKIKKKIRQQNSKNKENNDENGNHN